MLEVYHQPSLFDEPPPRKNKVGRPPKRIEGGKLRCGRCKVSKATSEFSKDRSTPTGLKYSCKECDKEKQNCYLAEPGNREKTRASQYAFSQRNKEKILAYRRAYYERNQAIIRLKAKQYYAENREELIEVSKRWARENPEKAALVWERRRARILGATGTHTAQEWKDVCERFGYRCLRCGTSDKPLTKDHIVPLTRGGSDSIENLQPLCKPCNSSKYTSIIDYRGGERG